MAYKRRYGGRRRFSRRTRRRFGRRRPRYSRYLRKRRGLRRRRNGVVSTLMKAILPTVPIKYIKTLGVQGSFANRSWFSDTIGNVREAFNYTQYLPGQSNIYDDGSVGTSTHLSFQQFASKKFKMKHQCTYTGQNVSNTTMILTVHIAHFRKDYNVLANPTISSILGADCAGTTSTGAFKIDKNSTAPGGYIANFYQYPQFTLFMSPSTCSTLKVVKTQKLRVPPGGWFKFTTNTGYKEFDKAWLNINEAMTDKIYHHARWSKMIIFSWHGELVQKAADLNSLTLSATDMMLYQTHSVKLKAVPYHRESIILQPPVNMLTASPLAFNPVVRPKGVIQITTTSTGAQDQG